MPENPTRKFLFIHHSVGGHWLAHTGGGLVSALNQQGFFVSDITYDWQPSWMGDSPIKRLRNRIFGAFLRDPRGAFKIGDRTDIGHFADWFLSPAAAKIMSAVYRENHQTNRFGDHANSTSAFPLENPGEHLENEVVMIKPCYPNSLYQGSGNDPATQGENPPRGFAAGSEYHTVSNCKRVYNDVLGYFRERPDKFFVIVTAPPRIQLPGNGQTARAFSTWLARDWLEEHDYLDRNVMVFDLFNVLTSGRDWETNDAGQEGGNHHRMWGGMPQHVVQADHHLLAYPRGGNDNHPSLAGLRKATEEFIGLFEHHYGRWTRVGLNAGGAGRGE